MCIAYFVILSMKKHGLYNSSVKYRRNLPELLCFVLFYNSYYPANYSSFTCHI